MKISSGIKKLFSFKWLQRVIDFIKRIPRKTILTTFICLSVVLILTLVAVLSLSLSIKSKSSSHVLPLDKASSLSDVEHIVILGAGLRPDGTPSDMLADRLKVGVELMKMYPNAKLLLTGDNSGAHYNEVASMKKFVMDLGVSEDSIIEDGRGYSTYESIYRAKNTHNINKAIIVTQEYHLYRAIYVADRLGIEAIGVNADLRSYSGQGRRNIREHMARAKDFFYTLIEYSPKEKS